MSTDAIPIEEFYFPSSFELTAECVELFNDGDDCWCDGCWSEYDQLPAGCSCCALCCNSEDTAEESARKREVFARYIANHGYVVAREGYEQFTNPNLHNKKITKVRE